MPNPNPNFVGRTEEINTIMDALASRVWIITVDGMGGIGKTTLVLQVAHLCKAGASGHPGLPEFAGFVWTSARDRPTFGLTDVVRDILYILSPFENAGGQFAQPDLLNLAIRALAVAPRLLIIDNFETVEDEPLHRFLRDQLPSPSKVLITSRHHIHTGERIVTIGGLEQADAISLLHQEAQRLQIPLQKQDAIRLQLIANKAYGIPVLRWCMEPRWSPQKRPVVVTSKPASWTAFQDKIVIP